MSVPHTGKLTAEIDGVTYFFNGDDWTGPSSPLIARLNAFTEIAPKHHFDIKSLAESIFQRAGIAGNVITWQGDTWDETENLEPGDLD